MRACSCVGGQRLPFLLAGWAIACQQPSAPSEVACAQAEERLGRRVCVHDIPDTTTWTLIGFPTAAVDQTRATTYMIPARDDARLPTVFVDASAFDMPEQSLHFRFLTESFPEFEALEYEQYLALTQQRSMREWFAGNLTEYLREAEEPVFGFTVWDPGIDPAETIACDEFKTLHGIMKARVRIGPVMAVAANQLQKDTLAACDVPSYDPSTALDYEAYTKAAGCGTVRRYTLAELAVAERFVEFGWQDILVVDEAPLDVQTIVAGIVTGTRQGELSHLNVRSANRGTPNCYVKNAYDLLTRWDGQLVRLECKAATATIVPISPEQAETCWAGIVPDPVDVVTPELDWTDLVGLVELPTQTAAERAQGVSRFGSKGTNLATLYQRIDPKLQLAGFLIPVHYYARFMADNVWSVDLGTGLETLTFTATIDRYLEDPVFLTDGSLRRERLLALQAAMQAAPCDETLIGGLEARLLSTFGSPEVMVRFRSSSNAEDALTFNGAGLYDSTSVCMADDADADALGPSQCDPTQSNERGICRGLTRVWASLWNMRAFEERAWFGIDHGSTAMGILVDTRSAGELANIVAFSGNPLLNGDERYLVNAQVGELDVVSALAGVWPEKELLTVTDGMVVLIERERGSTELPGGEWVLSDAQLRALGRELANIVEVFPIDASVSPTDHVLLDTEWKVRPDGSLVVKQVRPFLQ